jgi:hypothetical protein
MNFFIVLGALINNSLLKQPSIFSVMTNLITIMVLMMVILGFYLLLFQAI